MHYFGYALILVHAVLLLWSAGGFLEMFLKKVSWKPFTNPAFPAGVLVIHRSSAMFSPVIFQYGYFTRRGKTPQLMAAAYGLMALVCVIETFGYMTGILKYAAMGAEFLTYGIILLGMSSRNYYP